MPQLTPDYLKKYAKKYAFVETGTYEGDTVETAIKFGFTRIDSTELMLEFCIKARERFKGQRGVTIWHGDSPDMLRHIVPTLYSPSTFWLDAHAVFTFDIPGSQKYGKCPLLYELDAIAQSPLNTHTIFIDDVRLFNTIGWDFLKKETVIDKLYSINPKYKIDYLDGGFSFGRQFPEKDIMVAYVE
jgi:hypothetical protein